MTWCKQRWVGVLAVGVLIWAGSAGPSLALDVDAIEAGVVAARAKAVELRSLVDAADADGLDTSYERATLATAEAFFDFILWDASHVEDTFEKYNMWRIIDRHVPDVRAEAEALPGRMLTRTHEMLDRALIEIQAHRSDPRRRPGVFPRDVRKAKLEGDYWILDGRPVFFAGFNLQLNDDDARIVRSLGADLINMGPRIGELFPEGPNPDSAHLAQLLRDLDNRYREGFLSELNFRQLMRRQMPDWVSERYAGILRARGHFFEIDIEHPGAIELVTLFADEFVAHAKGHPGVFAYLLINEIGFSVDYSRNSSFFNKRFAQWAETRYGDSEALNESWGTSYEAFDAIRYEDEHAQNPAAWYDWNAFNKERVTDFVRRFDAIVKARDPDAKSYVKVVNERTFAGSMLSERPLEVSTHDNGVDREALMDVLDIHGCDTRILPGFPSQIGHPWYDKDRYELQWISQGISFDFMKSITPDKPIYDGEWHSMQTLGYRDTDIPGEHIRASLWHAHLSGMAANIIWAWTRGGPAQHAHGQRPTSSAYAGLANQPQLVEAYARGMIEVNAYAEELVAFARAARPIKILFSEASAMQDMSYLDKQLAAYEALAFLGTPIGFVTERMLTEGGVPDDCAWLIIPGNNHVEASTPAAIQAYVEQGGRVLIVGDTALQRTPQGRPHPEEHIAFVHELPRVPVMEAAALLEALKAQAPIGIALPAIDCRVDDHPMPFGIWWRTVEKDGATLAFALNTLTEPVAVTWTKHGVPVEMAEDLLAGKSVSATNRLLDPNGFMFMNIE